MLNYKNILVKRYVLHLSGREIAKELGFGKTSVNDFVKAFDRCESIRFFAISRTRKPRRPQIREAPTPFGQGRHPHHRRLPDHAHRERRGALDRVSDPREADEARKSTITCSQRHPEGWADMLSGDEVVANAIVKRATRHYMVFIEKKDD